MKYLDLLLEYNKSNLVNLFAEKLKQQIESDPSADFDNIVGFLDAIETPLRQQNKFQFIDPYVKWITQRYATGKLNKFEDVMSKAIPSLLKYDALKRKNKLKQEHRDINQIKDINQLMDTIDLYQEENTRSGKEVEKSIEQKFYDLGEAELIYNDSEIKVFLPKSKRASCFFGKNTRWCTAATDSKNYFNEYNKKGPLYVVLIKPENKRYQFHFRTKQFMDEKDNKINPNELAYHYPKLWDIFTPIAKKYKSILLNKNPSEEEKLDAVKEDGFAIKYIKNPSEEVQLAAVKQNGSAIEFIKNPSEAVKLVAVERNVFAIQYIKNPSEEVQLEAIARNPNAIRYIKNPSEEVQLEAVDYYANAIKYIENPSEKVQLAAVKQDCQVIQFIKNPSEEVQLAAVEQDGFIIRDIKNPTEAVKLAAVEQDGFAIQYIENPSEEVQLAAVKQDRRSIKFIKNPSKAVKLAAKKSMN